LQTVDAERHDGGSRGFGCGSGGGEADGVRSWKLEEGGWKVMAMAEEEQALSNIN
jgi:hypothetical protein